MANVYQIYLNDEADKRKQILIGEVGNFSKWIQKKLEEEDKEMDSIQSLSNKAEEIRQSIKDQEILLSRICKKIELLKEKKEKETINQQKEKDMQIQQEKVRVEKEIEMHRISKVLSVALTLNIPLIESIRITEQFYDNPDLILEYKSIFRWLKTQGYNFTNINVVPPVAVNDYDYSNPNIIPFKKIGEPNEQEETKK